jgi:hypothetical protein
MPAMMKGMLRERSGFVLSFCSVVDIGRVLPLLQVVGLISMLEAHNLKRSSGSG